VATDLVRNKVYNWLTFPTMALGLILNTAAHQWPGLGMAGAGLVVGGLLFLPFFLWGGMGAGDVKLMAAVGALMGASFVVNTALYASMIGGVLAVVFLMFKGELWETLKRIGCLLLSPFTPTEYPKKNSQHYPMPYAVIIALGAAAAYFMPSLLSLP